MKNKCGLLLVFASLSAAAFLPATAVAQVNFNLIIGQQPPQPRFEQEPAPRNGYVWAPGFWNWKNAQYVWSPGHWERTRKDYDYVRPEWHEENGQWRLNQGGWKHKRHSESDNDSRQRDRIKDRDYRHDEERDDDDRQDNDRHERGHKGFCPPGQAKKGNC